MTGRTVGPEGPGDPEPWLREIYRDLPEDRRVRLLAKRAANGQLARRARAVALTREAAEPPRPASGRGISLETVDVMSGRQFEEFLAWVFADRGVDIALTPATADRGADLVITRDGERTVVQAKRHALSSRVSGDAVREATAARVHYGTARAMVVTNAYFTSQAQETARENGVELIDREALSRLLARAQERRTLSPKDSPRRKQLRAMAGPVLAELRDWHVRLPTSTHPPTRTDQAWIAGQVATAGRDARLVAAKARELVVAIRAYDAAFQPNRVDQAYDLAITDAELQARANVVQVAMAALHAAQQGLSSLPVPKKYRTSDLVRAVLEGCSAATGAAIGAIDAAGLDRDEDLAIARNQTAVDAGWAEADRRLGFLADDVGRLGEAAVRAARW